MQIEELPGTDKRLYELVAPLVMNPAVLKQNYNFPFRTSEHFVWYVATDEEEVKGFLPIEKKRETCVLNNYWIAGQDTEVLRALMEAVTERWSGECDLVIVAFLHDRKLFGELGFEEEKVWTRYVRMKRERKEQTHD